MKIREVMLLIAVIGSQYSKSMELSFSTLDVEYQRACDAQLIQWLLTYLEPLAAVEQFNSIKNKEQKALEGYNSEEDPVISWQAFPGYEYMFTLESTSNTGDN